MKRNFDLLLAVIGLLIAFPIIAACAIMIRFGSSGSAIFRQIRVGKDEQPFVCYKLRTMLVNTKEVPSHELTTAAITPVGRYLRRLKLDELPQLWNILKGEMSFVGPRPCLPTQVELIAARRGAGVTKLLPGLTGYSQVAGIDMSFPELLAASDARYSKEWSLLCDLSLIWQTLRGAGRGDRVRR